MSHELYTSTNKFKQANGTKTGRMQDTYTSLNEWYKAEAGLREFTVITGVELTYTEGRGGAVGLGSGETLVLSSHFRGQPTRRTVMLCTNASSSTSADQFSVSSASTLTSVSDRMSGAAAAKTVSSCLLSR